MGRKQKAHMLKDSTISSVTPQPSAVSKRRNEKLRKSEPPAKRKKLVQELDEELSDSEFDVQLDRMRSEEKRLKGTKFDNMKNSGSKDGSEGEEEEEDSENVCSDDEDVEDTDDSDDENEETEDDDGDDDDSDNSDDEVADLDDDDSEDEDSDIDGDNDNSDVEHKSPRKSASKSKGKKTRRDSRKKQQVKKAEEDIPIEATEMAQDLIAKALLDKRTLFLKNLPQSVTADNIQSLSSDVVEVRIQQCMAKKSRNLKCAFVEFGDEATAVRNKSNFEHKKIGDKIISVDFVGEKSIIRPKKPQFPTSVDPRKLYVSGLGKEATVEDLKKLFPTASSIDFPRDKKENLPKGYAFVHFADEKACKDAHATMQNQVINGRVLTVMYGKKYQREARDSKKNQQSSRRPRRNKKTAAEKIEKRENSDERDSSENTEDSSGNDCD